MPEYRLYHFNGDHIRRAETLTAGDDLEAIAKAQPLIGDEKAELWRGARRLKTFNAPAE